jgi:hypothetical protein
MAARFSSCHEIIEKPKIGGRVTRRGYRIGKFSRFTSFPIDEIIGPMMDRATRSAIHVPSPAASLCMARATSRLPSLI